MKQNHGKVTNCVPNCKTYILCFKQRLSLNFYHETMPKLSKDFMDKISTYLFRVDLSIQLYFIDFMPNDRVSLQKVSDEDEDDCFDLDVFEHTIS